MKKIPHPETSAFFLIFTFFFLACSAQNKSKPMRIAVSKATTNYVNWLKKADTTAVFIDMYGLGLPAAINELKNCSGLLVTGGEDVQPEFYGKGNEKQLCKEMDPRRDTLETELIKKALEMKMPVLGICRGEQIINVALGGTLIVDIPAFYKSADHIRHQCEDYLKCYHSVDILKNTLLHDIVSCDTGFVTSNHHQAIEQLGGGLRINAMSKDGLIEGIEWDHPEGKSFLLAVQWHPERMDTSNSCSGKVLKEFFFQSIKFNKDHHSK